MSSRFSPRELGQVWGQYEQAWPDVDLISSVYSESNTQHTSPLSKVSKTKRPRGSHKASTSPSSEPNSTQYKPRLYCEDLLNHSLNSDFLSLSLDTTPLILPIIPDLATPIEPDIAIQILETALYDLHMLLEISSHKLTNEAISPYTTGLKSTYSSSTTGVHCIDVGIGSSEEYYVTAALFDQSMRLMCIVYAMYIYSKTHI